MSVHKSLNTDSWRHLLLSPREPTHITAPGLRNRKLKKQSGPEPDRRYQSLHAQTFGDSYTRETQSPCPDVQRLHARGTKVSMPRCIEVRIRIPEEAAQGHFFSDHHQPRQYRANRVAHNLQVPAILASVRQTYHPHTAISKNSSRWAKSRRNLDSIRRQPRYDLQWASGRWK